MINLSSLQNSFIRQYDILPGFQATDYECRLEMENLISLIDLYGEDAVLQLLKGKNDVNRHYFEDVGGIVLSELIKKKHYLLADFFVEKGCIACANQLGDFLRTFTRERQIDWIQHTKPSNYAIEYCLRQNDEELFFIALDSYMKTYREDNLTLEVPLNTAISLHQFKFLNILLQSSLHPIQEDLLSNKCTDQEAFLILEYIPRLNLTPKSIEFLAVNANFEPLKHVLECRPDLEENLTETTLSNTISDEVLIFLLSKKPLITVANLYQYFGHERFHIIDYIIESNCMIKGGFEINLLDCMIWMSYEKIASLSG